MDGAKGRCKAMADVFGPYAPGPRCPGPQWENGVGRIKKDDQVKGRRPRPAAYRKPTYPEAQAALPAPLPSPNPGAARSRAEGLEETRTRPKRGWVGERGSRRPTPHLMENVNRHARAGSSAG